MPPSTQDVQFGLAHRTFEAEQEPVVELGGMVDAVGVADEGVGEAAKIEEPIPIGIVASQTGDFESEHDADVPEADFRSQTREAASFDRARPGKAEIFVDDSDLLGRPSEFDRP
jgi:hypothetical protein